MAMMWVNKSGLLMFDIDMLATKCDQGYYQFKLTGHKKINQYYIYIYISYVLKITKEKADDIHLVLFWWSLHTECLFPLCYEFAMVASGVLQVLRVQQVGEGHYWKLKKTSNGQGIEIK